MLLYPPEWTLPLQTEAEVDEAVIQHQRQIEELHDRIRLLWSRRNSVTPVGRLPPEVLSEVFSALVEDYAEKYYPQFGSRTPQHWLAIMRVCRHWHDVALHTPRVWSHILIGAGAVDKLFTFLQRSGQSPLNVVQTKWRKISLPKETQEGLAHCMHRVQSLSADLGADFFAAAESSCLDAPLLETLSISTTFDASHISFESTGKAIWPRLQVLDGRDLPHSFIQAAVRPTLTSLKLYNVRDRKPADTWAGLLSGMPNLQHLELWAVMDNLQAPVADNAKALAPIPLPHLTSISLYNHSGASCAHLLRRISIPSDVRIAVETTGGSRNPGHADLLVKALASKSRAGVDIIGEPRLAQAITLNFRSIHNVGIKVYTQHDNHDVPDGRVPLDQASCTTSVVTRGSRVVDTFFTHYPLSEVHTALIIFIVPANVKLGHALSMLPHLRKVEIRQDDELATSLIHNLCNSSSFPKLESVTLTDIQWNKRHKGMMTSDNLLSPLVSALDARRKQGMGIKRLVIRSGKNMRDDYNYEKDIKRVKELVDEFEVDGEESDDECSTCGSTNESGSEDELGGTNVEWEDLMVDEW